MSLFVTATGSDVGKSVVCALLAHRYGAMRPLHYWKPVATGVAREVRAHSRREPSDAANDARSADSASVTTLSGGRAKALAEAFNFAPAVAPHWAARSAHTPITLAALSEAYRAHHAAHGALLVEGIGGALVPLTDRGETIADWVASLALGCVVIAHTGLGTLNHTLLTLEALRHRRIEIAGVVLVGPAHPDNSRSIAAFGHAPIIGHLPWLTPLHASALARVAESFDTSAVLARYLRHA